jgi:Rieske 2Fe-2S family protein
VSVLLSWDAGTLRAFANTCRHRGHELLPSDGSADRQSIVCPYHAWTYDLAGQLRAAPGFRGARRLRRCGPGRALPRRAAGRTLARLALRARGQPTGRRRSGGRLRRSRGALEDIVGPYAPETLLLADRHTYEVAANWKVLAENYHECYHCPLIHPELCQVSPPTSGDNYDLPGAWSRRLDGLRDAMSTMLFCGVGSCAVFPML